MSFLPLTRRYFTQLLGRPHERAIPLGGKPSSYGAGDGLESSSQQIATSLPAATSDDSFLRGKPDASSERRKLNAEKLASVAALASGFAHQIGTPLGVVRGIAEMLLTGTFEQSATIENLQLIISQIDEISRLVKLLLELAQSSSSIRISSDVRIIAERHSFD